MKHFTIGFGRAGETPSAKGSGVLVTLDELTGILTCAHVATYLRELKQPVGLIRLNQGPAAQYGILNMNQVNSHVAGEEPWPAGSEDIAFIHLPPHLAGNIKKDCAFFDINKNFAKPQPNDRSLLIQCHSVFGLVEDFTGATTRQDRKVTTLLKGVLTPGVLRDISPLNATL